MFSNSRRNSELGGEMCEHVPDIEVLHGSHVAGQFFLFHRKTLSLAFKMAAMQNLYKGIIF